MRGADGAFRTIGLPPGEVIVDGYELDPGIYVYEAYENTADCLTTTPVPLTLPGVEIAAINGVVESDDGMPLSALEIRVFEGHGCLLMGKITMAVDGQFVVHSLFPGDYPDEVVGSDDCRTFAAFGIGKAAFGKQREG